MRLRFSTLLQTLLRNSSGLLGMADLFLVMFTTSTYLLLELADLHRRVCDIGPIVIERAVCSSQLVLATLKHRS